MKIAFIADLHLDGYGNDRLDSTTQMSERLTDIQKTIYNITDYCRENDIKKISVLGDLLHGKSRIHSLALNVLLDFFRDNSDIEFIVTEGNHDLSSRGKLYVSALKCLDKEPNVIRILEPTVINDIFYVPYGNNMYDSIKNGSAKYLASHFGLNEAMLNSGISVIADIGMKDLENKYKTVILGHYHSPQRITNERVDIWYTGSPTQLDWGERKDEKRFLIVDMSNNQIESIPTTGYRKHFEFMIDNTNKEEILKKVKELEKDGHKIQLKKTEQVDIGELSGNVFVLDKMEKDITNRGITTSMSEVEKLSKYLDIQGIKDKSSEKYLNIAKRVLTKCSEKG